MIRESPYPQAGEDGVALESFVEFLRAHAPFDRLRPEDLGKLAAAASPATYADGQTVLKRWETPDALHVVVDGSVEERDNGGLVYRHSPGQLFDSKALIEGRTQHTFVARGGCRCLTIPVPLCQSLLRQAPGFRDFLRQDIARKTEAFISLHQQRESASFVTARIDELTLSPAVVVAAETTIREAVALMSANGSTAVVVTLAAAPNKGPVAGPETNGVGPTAGPAGPSRDRPVALAQAHGIFTARDIRERTVLLGLPDSTPIGPLASQGLITLRHDDYLYNCFALMTRHQIRHVVITRDDAIIGVVEQKDLLNFLSSTSFALARDLEQARNVDELAQAGASIPVLVRTLADRGMKPRYIAHLVTDLNRKVFRRAFEQLASPELLQHCALLVLGSEGRGEQLLRTDQDNAIVYRGPEPPEGLVEVATRFNQLLADIGYPPCPGNVMVSNPEWRLSADGYRSRLHRWLHEPSEEGFMNLAIFLDAATVAGDNELLEGLKTELFEKLHGHDSVVRHFAKAVVQFSTPLGLFGRFRLESKPPHAGRLDLKKGGIFPIVHGVRALALRHRINETSTIARIHALTARTSFGAEFLADLIEAFEFMSMLRLRIHLEQWSRGEETDSYVAPAALNRLERGLLKDSLKIVHHFKELLEAVFRLDVLQ